MTLQRVCAVFGYSNGSLKSVIYNCQT